MPHFMPVVTISIPTHIVSENTDFISTWNVSGDNTIALPLVSTGTYDFIVDWGDTTSDHITAYNAAEVTHTYSGPGVYTVTVAGALVGWSFAYATAQAAKIATIEQWGAMRIGSTGQAFWGCENLTVPATDSPDLTGANVSNMFCYCSKLTGDFSAWDVSGRTDFTTMFGYCSVFNSPLNDWDMSSAITLSGMFQNATLFNQPLDTWDTSNVTHMGSIFNGTAFNQDVSAWRVAGVTSMTGFASVLSTANYDLLLNSFALQTLGTNVSLGVASTKYTDSISGLARAHLVDDFGWNITDGGML